MRRQNGFSLIELMVVILLIGAFVLIAIPKIQTGTEINIKSASRNLTSTVKYLYNEAAFKKNIYRLMFDIEAGQYWVEVLNGNEYVHTTEPLHRKQSLPGGVHFKDVVTERSLNRSNLDDEAIFILFLPTGFVEPAAIYLETDNETYYTLATNPHTGGTKVYNEYVDVFAR